MRNGVINQKRLIQTFLELVKIDSPSGHEALVTKYLVQLLSKYYKSIIVDKAGNVIVKTNGTGEPILLSAHMDTVEPGRGIVPEIKKGIIKPKGKTILGMDNKSGMAVIIELLLSFKQNNINHIPIDAVFTISEETGCIGALSLDYRKIRAKRGLTFDNYSYPVGTITNKSFSYIKLDIDIVGRESHAGDVFENKNSEYHGVSAITIASRAIAQFPKRLLSKDTSLNFGTISGGNVRNTVPGRVHLKAELRSFSDKEILSYALKIKNVFEKTAKAMSGETRVKIDNTIKGFYINPKRSTFLQDIDSHFREFGLPVHYSVGGSDANIFNNMGIETLDLSVGGYGEHTTSEHIAVKDLYTITDVLYAYLIK